MIRKAFRMSVDRGRETEYERRHRPIWPELETALRDHGVRSYSIFLDAETNELFAYAEIECEEQWNAIASTAVCRRWWRHMRDVMPTNPDDSPISRDLREVFHIGTNPGGAPPHTPAQSPAPRAAPSHPSAHKTRAGDSGSQARHARLPMPLHAAIDLGAGSGRVLVGRVSAQDVRLEEAHRFEYAPRQSAGHLRWDFERLLDGLRTGLGRAAAVAKREGLPLRSIGVDSWGVDYGLIDEDGRLVEEPICYRDARTARMMERAFARIDRESLFRRTGIQFLSFNTIYQLLAHADRGLPPAAARLLMIPDLCHHVLCGSTTGEGTNASTTQLLNIETGVWDDAIFEGLELPRHLMPPLRLAGTELGPLRDDLRADCDLPDACVVQPATHDTAGAVAGTPLKPGWAFISSGTWSLVGVERTSPLLGADVLAANFTNERGVCGTFRFLRNVAGLWILDCCRREWRSAGLDPGLDGLLTGAGTLRTSAGFVDPDAPRFFNPASMTCEIRAALAETGQPAPEDPIALTKVILDSLALRYASVIRTIEQLTGAAIDGIHVVGGGSRNTYLNQATANATRRPVLAGPVEATGLGNILMQAVACGVTTLDDGRQRIASAFAPRLFEPADHALWEMMATKYEAIERHTISA